MAEWQLALFSAYELGYPANPRTFSSRMGKYQVDGFARLAFEGLVSKNLRFGRLGGVVPNLPSRGLETLRGLLEEFASQAARDTRSEEQRPP